MFRTAEIVMHCTDNDVYHQYQVGRKWVHMLRVSLVSWKRLRMQSVAELVGCR